MSTPNPNPHQPVHNFVADRALTLIGGSADRIDAFINNLYDLDRNGSLPASMLAEALTEVARKLGLAFTHIETSTPTSELVRSLKDMLDRPTPTSEESTRISEVLTEVWTDRINAAMAKSPDALLNAIVAINDDKAITPAITWRIVSGIKVLKPADLKRLEKVKDSKQGMTSVLINIWSVGFAIDTEGDFLPAGSAMASKRMRMLRGGI